ncbi:histidinol dehydrogenase [Halobacteriales archaeon QS_9_70_65]|nr:MAG: histidinol dehydrogenase [Halobacteriales archaeon QS_9_70_65]
MNVRAVAELSPDERAALFDRDAGIGAVRADVDDIVDRVRREGDVALREFAEKFDDVTVGNLDVTDEAERAYESVDDDVREAIETAAANVRAFHERQLPDDWRASFDGRELGRRFRPLERVGVYAPGGTAAYPSSVLMGAVPAAVAGVDHVAVATPPAEELPAPTLAAAHVAGVDAVYRVGGAQAVAALAYGTETVAPVQKIVGPGNRWTADPELVAADLLAQAEHDPNASVVCVTDDEATAEAVAEACDRQAERRERSDVIREALDGDASGILLARSMSEAVLFAEEYAAEHLSIVAADDESVLDRIDSAGSVFLGAYSPVAAGDYATGTNHVLPTGGLAKVAGGLSVDQFLRSTTVQRLDAEALSALRGTVTTLARAEGLEAHAESVDRRFDDGGDGGGDD